MFRRKSKIICINTKNLNDKITKNIRDMSKPVLYFKFILGDDKFYFDGTCTKFSVIYKIYAVSLFVLIFASFYKEINETKTVRRLVWNVFCLIETTIIYLTSICENKKINHKCWKKLIKTYEMFNLKDDKTFKTFNNIKTYFIISFWSCFIIQSVIYLLFLLLQINVSLDMMILGLILHTHLDMEYIWRATVYFNIYLIIIILSNALNATIRRMEKIKTYDLIFIEEQKLQILNLHSVYINLISLLDILKSNRNMMVR